MPTIGGIGIGKAPSVSRCEWGRKLLVSCVIGAANGRPTRTGPSMPSSRNTNDPQHWRDRAAEMRVLANSAHDVETSRTMLKLAADYEKLAQRAARRSNGLPALD
jgi:hypothetical protein